LTSVRNNVKRNFYRDSVQLLHLSEEAKKIDGVRDAAVVMGTTTNKEILTKLGLLTEEGKAASSSDMLLAVMAGSEQEAESGLRKIEQMILKPPTTKGRSYYSIDAATQAMPDANLAIVSIPGEHARDVVLKILDLGLSVLLFSDHVRPEVELELKQYAKSKGLLVMGPGAGTSIISGKAIGFANVLRKGKIGIVAAAGTGLQEVSVLLSEAGLGVSAGLGTGGGDVKTKVGGLMMLQSIDALERDRETDTIVVVSKPPDNDVKERVLDHIANKTKKRYVLCFLGPESYEIPSNVRSRLTRTKTLHAAFLEAAFSAAPELHAKTVKQPMFSRDELTSVANSASEGLKEYQRYIRGLYTGGTLAYETLIILGRLIGQVYSNAPLEPGLKLLDSYRSMKDSIVDLGEEEFTAGRAHPMIDPTIRRMRLIEEAKDQEVAVILMDIMLGYGSHPDPAGAMLGAIEEAKKITEAEGRVLPILAHVCGTENDPQPRSDQEAKLKRAGVYVFQTNALMAIAGAMVSRKGAVGKDALDDVYANFLRGF
jgi:succinyl-CoA synthetase alpha subunit